MCLVIEKLCLHATFLNKVTGNHLVCDHKWGGRSAPHSRSRTLHWDSGGGQQPHCGGQGGKAWAWGRQQIPLVEKMGAEGEGA